MSWVAVAIGGSAVLGSVTSRNAANTQSQGANRAAELQMDQYQQTRRDLMPWQQAGQLSLRDLMTRMGIRGTPPAGANGITSAIPNVMGGAPVPGGGMAPGALGVEGGDPNDPNFGQLTHQFGLQDFQASPAYQFNLEQGKMALDKASAARGKFYAPSTLQDIAKFSQGMASNEYQNAFSNYQTNMGNIWSRLYGLSGAGQNAAAQMGGFGAAAAGNAGNFGAQGANAQAAGQVGGANAITGGVNNYLNYQLLQQALARNQGSSVPGNDLMGQ